MNFRVRPARSEDSDAVYELAKLTGGGFVNLPPDRAALIEKLARSDQSFAREEDSQSNDRYIFLLEDPKTREIRGTCQTVGTAQSFCTYHLSTLTQSSPELGKTFRNQLLTLTTDLEGSSEVGGLFLHPQCRTGGWGALLARSRYLFMKLHRPRFGKRAAAQLRGVIDEAGNAPFWDALAGKFFGMSFPEADRFNAAHGTKLITDLMPSVPIYVALLTDAAKAAIGQPHSSGLAAMHMLEGEGFSFDGYVDIFDGGPAVTADIDDIRTVRESAFETVSEIGEEDGGSKVLLAKGRLKDFAACFASVERVPRNGLRIDREAADLLDVKVGDKILTVAR